MASKTKVTDAGARGYEVRAITDCPHVKFLKELVEEALPEPPQCADCGDTDEAWVCLTCARAGCSRYIGGHAATHSDASGHPLCLGWNDMSVWCNR